MRRGAGRRLRFVRDERGAAVVEFAIVVPILLTLVLAIIDFGRMLFVASSLAAAVRDGGRHAATLADPNDVNQVSAVRARVVSAFDPFGGRVLTSAEVTVSPVDASGAISVGVSGYTYEPITPVARLIGLGTVSLARTAVYRWERSS